MNQSQLQTFRNQAAQVLSNLISGLSENSLSSKDGLVDDLLRSLGGQAPRPSSRKPYDGFFPGLTLAEQRRRAASGLKVFIERIPSPVLIIQDDQIDDLIRVLRGLPMRPDDRDPYEGLFGQTLPPISLQQLQAWRNDAAQTLNTLVPKISGSSLTSQDGLVDDLLRSLSGQEPRPSNRKPYDGFFPGLPLAEQRRRAASGLKVFVEQIKQTTLIAQDSRIDDLIRVLRGLPARPEGRRPYEGLFPPITPELPPISPQQLEAWRNEAAEWLNNLVPRIAGSGLTAQDGLVDDLLRSLSGQAPRPGGRKPYDGFFPNLPLAEQRNRGGRGLKVFVEQLAQPTFISQDALIDSLIRILKRLPARPEGRRPYEGIFPALPALPPNLQITAGQLENIAPFGRASQIRKFVPYLNTTMAEFSINTRLRQAHFLAQIAHESGEFNFVEEIASGSAYEGREDLGNIFPGDGVRFKGRGLIQITGRSNYESASRALGVDLINNPSRLSDDDLAARSAGWFWSRAQLNSIADQDDVVRVTRVINGGTNGLSDRIQKLSAAKRTFGI